MCVRVRVCARHAHTLTRIGKFVPKFFLNRQEKQKYSQANIWAVKSVKTSLHSGIQDGVLLPVEKEGGRQNLVDVTQGTFSELGLSPDVLTGQTWKHPR